MNARSPRLAVVTATRISNGRVVVDVSFDRPGATKSNVPFFQPFAGGFITPREQDQVQVYQLNDDSYVAMFPLSGTETVPADMGEGELAFLFDSSTKIRVKRAGDGTFDVSVSASGDTNIHAEGNVNVTGGNVFIDGIDFDQHTHTYSDDTISDTGDGSGSLSSSSKTTDPPQ